PGMAPGGPGMLDAARPDETRQAVVERLPVGEVTSRVRVVGRETFGGDPAHALETAAIVLGVGKGIGGPAALPAIERLAAGLGAALAPTPPGTDAGRPPRPHPGGLTGPARAPRPSLAL